MRYDKLGNAVLHRLGKGASFAEVYLTAVELGVSIESKGPGQVVMRRSAKSASSSLVLAMSAASSG